MSSRDFCDCCRLLPCGYRALFCVLFAMRRRAAPNKRVGETPPSPRAWRREREEAQRAGREREGAATLLSPCACLLRVKATLPQPRTPHGPATAARPPPPSYGRGQRRHTRAQTFSGAALVALPSRGGGSKRRQRRRRRLLWRLCGEHPDRRLQQPWCGDTPLRGGIPGPSCDERGLAVPLPLTHGSCM